MIDQDVQKNGYIYYDVHFHVKKEKKKNNINRLKSFVVVEESKKKMTHVCFEK